MRPDELAGRTALVTGAAGILGSAFTESLLAAGASVVAVEKSSEALDALVAKCDAGARLLSVVADITDESAIGAAFDAAEREFGGVDSLLNNAATKGASLTECFRPLEEFSVTTWNEIVAVNLTAPFLCAREFVRRWSPGRTDGVILQVSSIYGVVGPDPRIYDGAEYLGVKINTPLVYSATKSGVLGMTRHMATHLAPRGIRVNAITPGGVQSGQSSEFVSRYCSRVPLGRMATTEDIVGAMIFLMSPRSAYVTGQNLIVDGGWTAW